MAAHRSTHTQDFSSTKKKKERKTNTHTQKEISKINFIVLLFRLLYMAIKSEERRISFCIQFYSSFIAVVTRKHTTAKKKRILPYLRTRDQGDAFIFT